MEKDNTQTPSTEIDTRENPPYYKIDQNGGCHMDSIV